MGRPLCGGGIVRRPTYLPIPAEEPPAWWEQCYAIGPFVARDDAESYRDNVRGAAGRVLTDPDSGEWWISAEVGS